MIRKALIATLACGAVAFGLAHAQSVTSAPPPTENLTRLQERVDELERMLQQATGENERLAIELRRARAENEQLKSALAQAQAQAQAGATPDAEAPAGTMADATRLLLAGRFSDAEAAFTAFVRANPQSPDAPEARYYIGRTQVAQRRYEDAADTFVGLLRDVPNAPRAADAWAMLGVSLHGMGKTAEACGVFRDLPVKYPHASAATRNIAATEARAAQCR